jgi:hypothetical protein
MKIWLLRVDDYDYGEYESFMIRAASPEIARELAIKQIRIDAAFDNSASFLTCPIEEVTVEGPATVLLSNYRSE